MLVSSEFDASQPVGSMIVGRPSAQLAPPLWMQWDGGTKLRADYPELEDSYPFGKLTGVARTLAATPTGNHVVAAGAYFVAAGGVTAAAIQHSLDGITWNTAATGGAVAAAHIIVTPSRLIALSGSVQNPIVSASALPTSAWTPMGNGPQSVNNASLCRAAYSPTLGRVVVTSAAQTQTLDDGSTTWVTRTATGGTRWGVCWTGLRFISTAATSAGINVSNDGITWSDAVIPEATTTTNGHIASNGNGTVVITGVPSGILISFDHGATWLTAHIVGVPAADNWRVQWLGDRFVIPTLQGMALSMDGREWFLEPTPMQALTITAAVARKSGVVMQISAPGSATAFSFTESATEFMAPNVRPVQAAVSGAPIPVGAYFQKAL